MKTLQIVYFLNSPSSYCILTILHSFVPRILCSTPFAVLTYFLIWYVPPFEQGKVIWFLIFYCLFQSMLTVSMSQNYKPRTLFLWSQCVQQPNCVFTFAVLPCAIFSSHHVHQQRPEREGLCNCLSYVRSLVWSNGPYMCVVLRALTYPFLCRSQAWWWRCWAQFWAPQSRDR